MTVIAKLSQTPGRGWRWKTSESGVTIDQGLEYYPSAALAEDAAERALGTAWPGSATEDFAVVNDAEEDGWHYVGETGEPDFENDWANVTDQPALAFRLREAGVVDMFGVCSGGDEGTAVFTLPVGYRPSTSTGAPSVGTSVEDGRLIPLVVAIAGTGEVGVFAGSAQDPDVVYFSTQFFLTTPTPAT